MRQTQASPSSKIYLVLSLWIWNVAILPRSNSILVDLKEKKIMSSSPFPSGLFLFHLSNFFSCVRTTNGINVETLGKSCNFISPESWFHFYWKGFIFLFLSSRKKNLLTFIVPGNNNKNMYSRILCQQETLLLIEKYQNGAKEKENREPTKFFFAGMFFSSDDNPLSASHSNKSETDVHTLNKSHTPCMIHHH